MDLTDEHHSDVSDALKRLVDGGFLKSEGRGRGTSYRLAKSDEPLNEPLNEPINEPIKGDVVEQVFAQILANQGIKRDDIVSRTGKSLATVKRALEELTSGDAPNVEVELYILGQT